MGPGHQKHGYQGSGPHKPRPRTPYCRKSSPSHGPETNNRGVGELTTGGGAYRSKLDRLVLKDSYCMYIINHFM